MAYNRSKVLWFVLCITLLALLALHNDQFYICTHCCSRVGGEPASSSALAVLAQRQRLNPPWEDEQSPDRRFRQWPIQNINIGSLFPLFDRCFICRTIVSC